MNYFAQISSYTILCKQNEFAKMVSDSGNFRTI